MDAESLIIEVGVETNKAKKQIRDWMKELEKAETQAEKIQKALSFSVAEPTKHSCRKTQEEKAYLRDIARLQKALTNIRKLQKEVLDTSSVKTSKSTSTKDYDVLTEYGGGDKAAMGKITEISKGIKTVTKDVQNLDGEWSNVSTTISKAKGKLVDGGMRGDTILTTKEDGRTKYRTQEIADGFKIVREYIQLANGELYLMAEKTSKVKEEVEEVVKKTNTIKDGFKNLGKQIKDSDLATKFNKFGKRISSIITYRIARSLLSAFTNAFKQGFELLSDDNAVLGNVKDTFSTVATSLQASFTTILIPLFESLANVLMPIADDFINMANAISLTNAKAEGQAEYFELSKEKIEAYAKSLRQANKQLSTLDKFATLSGKKKADLGSMISVDEASEETILNEDKYKNVIGLIDTISSVLGDLIKGATAFFNFVIEHIDLIAVGLGTVLAVTNPVLALFSGLLVMISDASAPVKILTGLLMGLAGAMIGIGIAKAFMAGPQAGLIAAGVGAGLGITIATIAGSLNAGASFAKNLEYNTSGNTGSYNSSEFYSGISQSSKSGYSAPTAIRGDVYIDGQKAGKILEQGVYAEGARVGHFKG